MSRIRSKDTKPELAVREYLFSKGLRYRLHRSKLPGKPDISNQTKKGSEKMTKELLEVLKKLRMFTQIQSKRISLLEKRLKRLEDK